MHCMGMDRRQDNSYCACALHGQMTKQLCAMQQCLDGFFGVHSPKAKVAPHSSLLDSSFFIHYHHLGVFAKYFVRKFVPVNRLSGLLCNTAGMLSTLSDKDVWASLKAFEKPVEGYFLAWRTYPTAPW